MAGLVAQVVEATAQTLGADLVSLVADSAGDGIASLDYAATSMALLAVWLEHDGRDIAVVGIVPLWLSHESIVSPVLVGLEPRILRPL
jgi:hypothetical protein